MELNCKWIFIQEAKNHQRQGYQGLDSIFKKYKVSKEWFFTREILQNSLDARVDKKQPVHVTFSFGCISKENYPNFFALSDHVDLCCHGENNTNISNNINRYLKGSDKVISFLKVSDFNTTGLVNDGIRKIIYSSGFGRDADVKDVGGAFGYGHNVYVGLSPVRSFLASSYDQNNQWSFAGLSNLMSHEYDGHSVSNSGYYTSLNDGDPVTIKENIPRIFRRSEDEGFGTDIFVMGYKENSENAYELVRGILANYWMAILNEKITIEIKANHQTIRIDKNTLAPLIQQYFKNDTSEYNPWLFYDAVVNINKGEGNYDTSKYRYIEIENDKIGKCKLYVNIDKSQHHKKYVEYMRLPMMLIMDKRIGNSFPYPCSALFICDNSDGNQLLRSMESPSHDEWDYKLMRIDERVRKSYSTFVTDLRTQVKNLLEGIFEDKDVETLTLDLGDLLNPFRIKENKTAVGAPEEKGGREIAVPKERKKVKIKLPKQQISSDALSTIDGVGENPGNGKYGSGRGPHPTTHQGDTPTPGMQNRYTSVNRNKKGKVGEMMAIDYDVMARVVEGQIWHRIFITPSGTYDNNSIYISIGTDVSNDDNVNIVEALNRGNQLKVSGNIIKNIPFVKGQKMIIDILFSDNIKHSLKIISLYDEHK